MRTLEEVKDAFTPVGLMTATQQMRLLKLQNAFIEVATQIVDLVPESPNRTAAIRKMLEAKFTCVQEISHSKELRSNEKSHAQTESESQAAYEEREKARVQRELDEAKAQQSKLEAEQQDQPRTSTGKIRAHNARP